MKAAAYDTSMRNSGWSHLSNVDVGSAAQLSYLDVSTFPPNRVYYGTSNGKLFRLDNANSGNPVPTEITGSGFPRNAFLAYIDIDPINADHVLVVFSNYGVMSLFSTLDGGVSWIPVAGNLEEHPDGSGAGPSVRCVRKLRFQDHTIYLAGTSAGLFSTRELKGDSTIWSREGAGGIGNVLVDDIAVRSTDGFIAVGTHGNGVYSCHFDPSLGAGGLNPDAGPVFGNPYPNPSPEKVCINVKSTISIHITAEIISQEGKVVRTLGTQHLQPGEQTLTFSTLGLKSGLYFLVIKTQNHKEFKKIIVAENVAPCTEY
jgi:hypothetical protein